MKRISPFWTFVLVLAAITVAYAAIASRSDRGGDQRRELAEIETPALLAEIPLPPGAKPHAPRSQKTLELRGRFAVVVEQELTRPGAFASTDAFYRTALPAAGWRETSASSVDRGYCRAPYALSVEQSATFEDSHRFTLRLMYDDRKRGKWKCDAVSSR
jgi:hypothetical protein